MSDPKFDPYYKWLGISADDQPANHYRLLGVDQFESDADVIESAAQRQIAHVRTFALGNYAEASQALLNELSTARVTLLNPNRKKEYDKRLKAELQSNVPSIDQGSGESRQQRALVEVAIEPVPGRNRVSSRRASAAPRRKKLPLGVIGVVVLVLGIVLAFSLYVSFSGGDERVAAKNARVLSQNTAKQEATTKKENPPNRKKLPANENTLGNAIASGASTQSSTQGKSAGLAPVASVDPEPSESTPIASTGTSEPSGSDAAAVMSGVVGDPPPPAIAPFDSATAKEHQEAWAKYLGVTVETENSIGMKLRVIPAGTFTMGEGGRGQEVTLTKPFMLGTHEVTQEQYEKIMDINPSLSKGGIKPVTHVSWEDAVKFCLKLSELPAEKAAGRIYRLPTEAQWEHACRSGTQTTYSFGDDESKLGDYGWFRDNSNGRNHPCGVKQPNAWGLSDMHGNVWEWCNDWFGSSLSGSATDPKGPQSGSSHVLRGASFGDYAVDCRSASRARDRSNPHVYGFRVSCVPSIAASTKIAASPPMNSGEDVEPAATTSPPVPEPANNGPAPAVAPFDIATAKKHQEAWAKHLGVPVEVTNAISMTFVLIPPGEFQMGVSETLAKTKGAETQWYGNSQPAHRVRITKPFYMSRYEVTQKQFRGVVGGGLTPVTGDGTRYPATQIGWTACVKFCDRLTEQGSGIPKGGKVRLPTEAEWEFACRAGTDGWFWMGDAIGPAEASLRNAGRKMRLEPIDAFTPNPFGLFNIHGNVMEWCSDWLSADYYGTSPVEDPQGPPNGEIRVHRGGGYSQPPFAANSYWRHGHKSDTRSTSIGFRPIVELSLASNQPSAGTGAVNVKAGNALEVRDEDRSRQGLEEPSGKQNSAQLQSALSGQENTPQAALAPFDATTAQEHQEVWAKYLGVTVETENSIGMKLRVIPAGTFTMGEGDEAHEVTLTKPLLLGIHEVTQKQYERVMEINPSKFNQSSSNPVDQVIWNDAVEFCRRLSALPQEKQAGRVYRLPTEAEWEYACRAGTTTQFSFGHDESQLSDSAWFKGNMSFGTQPVGEKKPNPWGLYDMHGNVYEWCNDWAADYPSGSATDPTGPQQGYKRVLRGGGWSYAAELCRSAVRGENVPSFRFYSIGFRVACVPSGTASTKIATSPPMDSSEDVEPAAVTSPPIPEPTGDGPAPAAAPFDAADAKVHQGKWARHLGERVEVTNSLGMKLRVIPPGTFMMGREDGKTDEKPVHQVTLTKPILLGAYEVTQREYQQVMGVNPSEFKGLRNPVTNLSWDDANEFCRRLSLLPREKRAGRGYRLPTEAEWEFACRAGTMTTYNFGDNESSLSRHAWSKDNSGRKTHSGPESEPRASLSPL
jgi:formylglycine-generating enzyme required for sulfatase activity